MGISVSAIRMSPFKVLEARSTEVIVSVECLRTGQKACTADKNGNIGTGNHGNNNFGDYNDGDSNIGEQELGRQTVGTGSNGLLKLGL